MATGNAVLLCCSLLHYDCSMFHNHWAVLPICHATVSIFWILAFIPVSPEHQIFLKPLPNFSLGTELHIGITKLGITRISLFQKPNAMVRPFLFNNHIIWLKKSILYMPLICSSKKKTSNIHTTHKDHPFPKNSMHDKYLQALWNM